MLTFLDVLNVTETKSGFTALSDSAKYLTPLSSSAALMLLSQKLLLTLN